MLTEEERSTWTLTEGRVVSKQEVRIGERSITSKRSFIALFFEYPIRKSLEDIAIVFLTKTIRLTGTSLPIVVICEFLQHNPDYGPNHTCTVLSALPVAMRVPSGDQATDRTGAECPR